MPVRCFLLFVRFRQNLHRPDAAAACAGALVRRVRSELFHAVRSRLPQAFGCDEEQLWAVSFPHAKSHALDLFAVTLPLKTADWILAVSLSY